MIDEDYVNDDGDRIIEKPVPGPGGGKKTIEINLTTLLQSADRYTANDEILRLEQELQDEGVELANPAKPLHQHPMLMDCPDDPAEIRALIEAEVNKDDPNRERIGMLNRVLQKVEGENAE